MGLSYVIEWPKIGEPVPMAIETNKEWVSRGMRIILWTVRDGQYLEDAVKYCEDAGIELYGINKHPNGWSDSPKAYAHYYIDDMAVGCPLINYNGYKVVDWAKVKELLKDR
jgi:hypothetical protein